MARWDDETQVGEFRERSFAVEADGRTVPGVLWLPAEGTGPRPLVLLGHGATRHKRVDYLVALGRRLASDHGFAVAAIDAPGHGDRRAPGHDDDVTLFGDFLAEWTREGTVDDVVAEWQAAIDALRDLDEVGDGPVGYWGLSMGTIYGVPLVAAEIARIKGIDVETVERRTSENAASLFGVDLFR